MSASYDDIINLPHPTSAKHPRMPMIDRAALLDEKLRLLADANGEAIFTWFLPDEKKAGGAYVSTKGCLQKIDPLECRIVLTDGTVIPIEHISAIEDLVL